MNVCKTCGNLNMNKFCPDCGQKLLPDRITVKSITKNTFAHVFNLEQGFFFTVVELIKRPGELISNYINGATKRYHNPIGLSVFLMTISVVIMALFIDNDAYIASMIEQMKQMYTQMGIPFEEEGFKKVMNIMQNFYTVLPLLFIPFFAFIAKLFFKEKKLHFAEHMVVFIYATCIMALLAIVTNIVYAIFPELLKYMMIISFPTWIFSIYCVIKTYYKQSYLLSIIYSVLIFILSYALFLIASIILGIIIGLFIFGFKKIF